jgi:hypothetical protein
MLPARRDLVSFSAFARWLSEEFRLSSVPQPADLVESCLDGLQLCVFVLRLESSGWSAFPEELLDSIDSADSLYYFVDVKRPATW